MLLELAALEKRACFPRQKQYASAALHCGGRWLCGAGDPEAFAQSAGGSSGKGKGTEAVPTCPKEPASMPGDFPKLLHALLEGGKNGAGEREVRNTLMSILMPVEAQ